MNDNSNKTACPIPVSADKVKLTEMTSAGG